MRISFEQRITDEHELPDDLGETDVGRTWWDDFVWFIWTGEGWQKALATTGRRR